MDSTKDGLPQLPSDDEIIDISNQQSRVDDSGFPTRYAVYPSREAPIAFIKCGYVDDGMLAEARNQQFAYTTLQQQPQEGIRIPRVYRVISRGQKVYIVMEYIRGKTIKEQLEEVPRSPRVRECYDQVARAIKFFLSIHIDTDITAPGPVGGGVIRHPLFRWAVAPREYSSVADLQEHVEAVFYSQHSTRSSRADYLLDCQFSTQQQSSSRFFRRESLLLLLRSVRRKLY